jgi:hypothetical protein
MISLSESAVVVVGVVRDCGDCLADQVLRLREALQAARKVYFFLVESDSSDNTVAVLESMVDSDPDFAFESLGNLTEAHPMRTERIAWCRNVYLEKLSTDQCYLQCNYVLVADFDGVNSRITAQALETCWTRSDWDVCTANQDGPYYDIWALRHEIWSPNDYEQVKKFLRSYGVGRYRAQVAAVLSKMIVIKPGSSWMRVESAFGGLAIYKIEMIVGQSYVGVLPSGDAVCEHVPLHREISRLGGKIYINPDLVNCGALDHVREVSGLSHLLFCALAFAADLRDALKKILKV